MIEFTVRFIGRKVGAIGITYPVTLKVSVETPAAAAYAPYDRGFEHIRAVEVVRTPLPKFPLLKGLPATRVYGAAIEALCKYWY